MHRMSSCSATVTRYSQDCRVSVCCGCAVVLVGTQSWCRADTGVVLAKEYVENAVIEEDVAALLKFMRRYHDLLDVVEFGVSHIERFLEADRTHARGCCVCECVCLACGDVGVCVCVCGGGDSPYKKLVRACACVVASGRHVDPGVPATNVSKFVDEGELTTFMMIIEANKSQYHTMYHLFSIVFTLAGNGTSAIVGPINLVLTFCVRVWSAGASAELGKVGIIQAALQLLRERRAGKHSELLQVLLFSLSRLCELGTPRVHSDCRVPVGGHGVSVLFMAQQRQTPSFSTRQAVTSYSKKLTRA